MTTALSTIGPHRTFSLHESEEAMVALQTWGATLCRLPTGARHRAVCARRGAANAYFPGALTALDMP